MNHDVTTQELVAMIFTGNLAFLMLIIGGFVFTVSWFSGAILLACALYIARRADRRYNIIRKKLGIYE